MVRKWTEDEIEYLEYFLFADNGEPKDLRDTLEILDRSFSAVKGKAYKLRKSNENLGYDKKPYTERDIKILKSMIHNHSLIEIGEVLGRSRQALSWKAKSLGLNKHKNISDYDRCIRQLAKDGHYLMEISRKLGIRDNSLYYYMKKHGIECRKATRKEQNRAFIDENKIQHYERMGAYDSQPRHQPNT